MAILLYGATGYTGQLIARHAKGVGAALVLAGRDAAKVGALAGPLDFEARAASLDNPAALDAMLKGVSVVLHAAGPFSATSRPMVDACLRNRCHYADVTGEISVFEALAARDAEAKAAGVTLIPGVGFDVVPSDCLAAHVASRLPDATHLAIAIAAPEGRPSRGTTNTAVESIGLPTPVRRGGRLSTLATPPRRDFDFGQGPRTCVALGWGDVSTAWHSTHVPEIEVYFELSAGLRGLNVFAQHASGFLQRPGVQRWLKAQVDRLPEGPSDAERLRIRSHVVAVAENGRGGTAAALLQTPEGYTLTSRTALDAVQRLARGEGRPGFFTPSGLFGADHILRFEGVVRTNR